MAHLTTPRRVSRTPSLMEEIANAITHGIGAILSLVAMFLLLLQALQLPEAQRLPVVIGNIVFGFSLFFLYLMSTLYHSFVRGRVRRIFQVLDHVAIYVLIAGTLQF